MEVLTGRGEVLTCSREENPDLFAVQFFGTLGYILK